MDQNTDFEYNLQEDIQNFIELTNKDLLNFNNQMFIKNQSELTSLLTMISEYKSPIQTSTVSIPKLWFDTPVIKNFAKQKLSQFNDLLNPQKNISLSTSNTITKNLSDIKQLLSETDGITEDVLNSIKTPEDLINNLSLPDNYDTAQILSLLKLPNLNIESLTELSDKLKLPEIKIDSLTNIANIIPSVNLGSIVQGGMSGLNFNRMQKSITKDLMKEFPEGTDWKSMCEFNAVAITKAIMRELSNMKFYIEPGEIKVLTNGAPSTHTGKNINRIKIKLKS